MEGWEAHGLASAMVASAKLKAEVGGGEGDGGGGGRGVEGGVNLVEKLGVMVVVEGLIEVEVNIERLAVAAEDMKIWNEGA